MDAAAVRPLRLRVLRPGGSLADTVFDGDDDPVAGHFAIGSDAVATVVPQPHPVDPRPGDWRIRGMATAPAARGQGLGGALVAACLDHVRASGGTRVWLHARVGAVRLYERAGFAAETGVFDVPGIGPHVRMVLALG